METIETVFKQQFQDFELIVVDDGSTDDLRNVINAFIESDKLKYFKQSNAGVSAARNAGAELARGEYLIFLDSDDKVTSTWLTDYAFEINLRNPDVVYCGIQRMKDNIIVAYTDPNDPFNNGVDYGNVIPGSFCIKRSFFKQVGRYDPLLAYGENTELGFRIKMENPSLAFVSNPNLMYMMHENSHGKNAYNKMKGIVYTINKHPQLFKSNPQMSKRFLTIAGVAAIQCQHYTAARDLFWRALQLAPFNMASILRFLISQSTFISKRVWVSK